MVDTQRYRSEALGYGKLIADEAAREAGERGITVRYEPHVSSNGTFRFLHVYDEGPHDSVLTIQAPTYYDLMMAAMGAWNAIMFAKRGF